jgi:predicted DNA-binding protein
MDLDHSPRPADLDAPPRRRRGRPKLYDRRQYVPLTLEQQAALDAIAEAKGGCRADHIREAIDRYRELMREEVMSA